MDVLFPHCLHCPRLRAAPLAMRALTGMSSGAQRTFHARVAGLRHAGQVSSGVVRRNPQGNFIARKVRTSRRMIGLRPARSLVQSFNYAFDRVIHTLSTQRNMRIHFAAATAAMLACVVFGVTRTQFALVIFAAAFVIVAEMLNTAIEAAIDVVTTSFNPLAKIAKDVAAGAVLIATFNAIAVAYLVFGNRVGRPTTKVLVAVRDADVNITFVVLVLTFLAVVAGKAMTRRLGRPGTSMRGGFPSGHAAIAFAAWMSITFVTAGLPYTTLVSSLAFLLALLVSHTRVESGVHTWSEVFAGAVLGSLVALLIFQLAHHSH